VNAVTFVNHPYAADVARPEALLARYRVLTGWARAVAAAVVHLHGLLPLPVRQLRSRLPPTTALLAQDHGGVYVGGWR
jgi:hypothetical protein